MNDRETLLSTMYDSDENEKPKKSPIPGASDKIKSRRIVQGITRFDVPTVEYVDSLEKIIQSQNNVINQQSKSIKKLEFQMNMLKTNLKKDSNLINNMNRELETKINRRDY